jgi:putative transcriptional regulator
VYAAAVKHSPDLEAPYMLVASPLMNDPNFARTVMLVGHHDQTGALGWVVNRVLEVNVQDVLPDRLAAGIHPETPLRLGGPVGTTGLTVLLRAPLTDEATEVAPGLFACGDAGILKVAFAEPPSGDSATALLVVGYAGWGARQLDREITDGWWFVMPFDSELAFSHDAGDLWEQSMRRLGLDQSMAFGRSEHVH